MWKGLIPILLVGCTHTTPVVTIEKPPVFHPAMPAPYKVCNVLWEVLEVNNSAKVAVSYNDNLTLAICLGDVERYITQLINITCHYRQELTEKICNKEIYEK